MKSTAIESLNPDLVKIARDFRGLNQTQLADKLGITQGKMSKIESGLLEADASTIEQLAEVLRFPSGFFYLKTRAIGLGSHDYFFRKKQSLSSKDRRYIEALVNILRGQFEYLLSNVEMEVVNTVPSMPLDKFDNPEKVAAFLRKHWLVPSGPIKNVTELLEDAGVLVIPCDFGTDSFDATSIWPTGQYPFIFINKDLPGDRWRFTLCHELGHLVMHNAPAPEMEREADQFASYFLMPKEDIKPDLKSFTIQTLANNLKPYWRVSIQALIQHAHQLGTITSKQKQYFFINLSKKGYRKKEPNPLPQEKPTIHEGLLNYYEKILGYTVDELSRVFQMYPKETYDLHFAGRTQRLRAVN